MLANSPNNNANTPRTATRICLLHGWGYDAGLWREVVPLLDGCEIEVADLGYFGPAQLPQTAPPTALRIAVGHSLGALCWLTQTALPWRALIAIGGFARFCATPDFPHAVAPRVLQRMRQRFDVSPAAVLADFHTACGGAGPALPADTQALAAGLALLEELDGREMLAQRRNAIWALAARNDAIVPAAMSAASFQALPAARLRWLDDGGHLLPLTQAQHCAALIREVADEMASYESA